MAIIFVSYGRAIQEKVRALTQDLESLGHEVWFDQALAGGQAWWDQVLTNIRACDVFVFALAPASLESQACRLEYAYAGDLGKVVLPVLVADGVATDLLPPALATIQYVDCRAQDKSAVVGLVRAFAALPPARALPDPLPQAPDAPVSYLGSLGEQVQSAAKLTFEQQTALVLRLKQGIKTDGDGRNVRALLQQFRARDDLFARVADEIDELLRETKKPAVIAVAAADPPRARGATVPPQPVARQDVVPPRSVSAAAWQTAAAGLPRKAFTRYLFVALAGVVLGFMLPALTLDMLNRSLRTLPIVFITALVLGMLPVLVAQLVILKQGGHHGLAGRWKWVVPIGWVLGCLIGGSVSLLHIMVFGAAGGGVAALALLLQAYVRGRSTPQAADTVN